MKKNKRIVTAILTPVIMLSLGYYKPINVKADTKDEYQQKIDSNNQKKQELEDEKSKISDKKKEENDKLSEIRDQLENKSTEIEKSQNTISNYEKQISEMQQQLQSVENNVIKLNNTISENEESIKKKENEISDKEQMLGKRIRTMYKVNYMDNFIALILDSDSFSDMISKAVNYAYFINNDKKLIKEVSSMRDELKKQRSELDKKKQSLEKEKKSIQDKKDNLQAVKDKYQEQKDQLDSEYNSVQELEQQKSELVGSLSSKEKELNDKIGDLASYNESLQKQMDDLFSSVNVNNSGQSNNSSGQASSSNNGESVSSGSGYMRPVSGGYISCEYGPRIHPVTHKKGFHTGVDIAVSSGTPIYASNDGVVAAAQWNTAYGNMVIINHGNGVQTLYGHSSRYIVSAGQKVKKGQVIAYVGSTGWSTGPHLHYEVRVNGNHTNPGPYM